MFGMDEPAREVEGKGVALLVEERDWVGGRSNGVRLSPVEKGVEDVARVVLEEVPERDRRVEDDRGR